MNYSVIQVLLTSVIRHLLTIAAGYLAAYGVTADQQTAFVGSTTAVVVSVVLFAISQVWSYFSKVEAFRTPLS